MGCVEKSQREVGRENSKTKVIISVAQSDLLRVLLDIGDTVTIEPHENGSGRGLAVDPILYIILSLIHISEPTRPY